jgi:L-Ala-D/L-Glu epimerase
MVWLRIPSDVVAPSPQLMIRAIEARDVDVALREPFGIAGGAQVIAELVLVRVELADGTVGWGEAAPFPAYNGETRAAVHEGIAAVVGSCVGIEADLVSVAERMGNGVVASARCAVEMAVIDAVTRRKGVALWRHLGGLASEVRTDCTITTGSVEAADAAAARFVGEGFDPIKVKVGGVELAHDVERLRAICARGSRRVLLDANGGLGVDDAVVLVEAIRSAGGEVVAFEQPVAKEAIAELREVHERGGVVVIADESAASIVDVKELVGARAVQGINVKVMKSGLVEALGMIGTARAAGLGLMIGGMVESPMAMTVSASIAAGMGGFDFVDLDTPYWMIDAPMDGGAVWRGPVIDLSGIAAGHGVVPRS